MSFNYSNAVTYVYPDGEENQRDVAMYPPAIGQGYIDEKGDRYRVVDLWVVDEKHGAMGAYGVYAYLEVAEGDDDRPGRLHPAYYRAED